MTKITLQEILEAYHAGEKAFASVKEIDTDDSSIVTKYCQPSTLDYETWWLCGYRDAEEKEMDSLT